MVLTRQNQLFVDTSGVIMKFRYDINEQSYVVVDDSNGYVGQHFKNGCSRNLMEKRTNTLEEMENWIKQLKEVLNG